MGYDEAATQGFKFLNKLVDFLLRRRNPKKQKEEENKPEEVLDPSNTLDALRIISKDLQVPRERKSDGALITAGDICWTFQIKFHILRHTNDAREMLEILSFLRKLISEKVLKRFKASCPGVPGMLHSICICCSTLDDNRDNIINLTTNIERQIRVISLEVSRVLLLPFLAEERHGLHDDTRKAIARILNLFGYNIDRCCSNWTEEVSDQIKKTVEFIPSIISLEDLLVKTPKSVVSFDGETHPIGIKDGVQVQPSEIAISLIRFCRHIPKALSVLANEHHEIWQPTLQSLCSKLPPEYKRGPLCKLWRRLVISSPEDGFTFIRELMLQTFSFLGNQVEVSTKPEDKDMDECITIVGCMNDLLLQCCEFASHLYGGLWHARIKPVIDTFKSEREFRLKRDTGEVFEYIDKMLQCIDKSYKLYQKHENKQKIEEVNPLTEDPTDSLFGARTE